ncbi:MAG TPA: lyase family protein, partial [Roseiflexaceae bacterium]|nr:lyase family protein [Roseiflexaceae bacterium]
MSQPALLTTPAMATVFAPAGLVERLLVFEGALARAEAEAGVIPPQAADAIAACCRAGLFDVEALYREAAVAGTLAIPLVRALAARVGGEAAAFVHWGATSQDALDTALAMQLRDGLDLLVADLLGIAERCTTLAQEHRRTLMPGRTLLQHALPITFGLKAARWLALATRQVRALLHQRREGLAAQLGGAAGTLAALGAAGLRVAELLANALGLPPPDLPWHAERDRVAGVAAAVAIAAGS